MPPTLDGFAELADVEVERRRVFVRADLDDPLDANGSLLDDAKVRASAPTLRALLEREAQVVVGAHCDPAFSLESSAARLAELLDTEVYLPDESVGLLPRKLYAELRPGRLLVLENLERDPREAVGEASLARELAANVEVYVGDALAGPHGHASIALLPKLVHERVIGPRLHAELVAANRLRHAWGPGLVLLVGGTLRERRKLLDHATQHPHTTVLAKGALARTLLRARSGASALNESDGQELSEARSWLERAREAELRVEFDAGSDTAARWAPALQRAEATLIVGQLAEPESEGDPTTPPPELEAATRSLGFVVAVHERALPVQRWAGESALARMGFISTAGDALVQLLCQQKLAGLEALRRVR